MKKIIIGLLIVAAGAAAYYLYTRKKSNDPVTENKNELILGKWKLISATGGYDSLVKKYEYEFIQDSIALIRDSAEATADSSIYAWSKTGELQFKENAADSTTDSFVVLKLNKDSLQVRNKDSITYLFTRL